MHAKHVIRVRQDLAESEARLVLIQRPVEHERDQFGGRARHFATGLRDQPTARRVMRGKFVDPGVQADERQAVPGSTSTSGAMCSRNALSERR